MEKQKRWQLFVIIAVIFLTVYNILPTVFYYTKPLNKPIGQSRAESIAKDSLMRVNSLEKQSMEWLGSFTKLLKIKPTSIDLDKDNPQLIHVGFKNSTDADLFKSHLPTAGSLITFAPAQLNLSQMKDSEGAKKVTVVRQIPIQFEKDKANSYFTFSDMFQDEGQATKLYQTIIDDRLLQLGYSIGGTSENAQLLDAAINTHDPVRKEEFTLALANSLQSYSKIFAKKPSILNRYLASLTQGNFANKRDAIEQFVSNVDGIKNKVRLEKIQLKDKEKELKTTGGFLEQTDQQRLDFLQKREDLLSSTTALLKNSINKVSSGKAPWSYQQLKRHIHDDSKAESETQVLQFGSQNPLIQNITVDLSNQKMHLRLHNDIVSFKDTLAKGYEKNQLEQLIFNEIARISRDSREDIEPFRNGFKIELSTLSNAQSFLALDLGSIASKEAVQIKELVSQYWQPKHQDLARDVFPIWDYETYNKLPASEKKLGLVIYAPSTREENPMQGFRTNSIYVIAKGVDQIMKKMGNSSRSPEAEQFMQDFDQLRKILTNKGYYGYPGSTYPLSSAFAKDFIFESEDFYSNILMATREDFKVNGTRKYATLEFTNVKQRIYAENQIDNKIHEDLLKWKDEYQSAQVDPSERYKYDLPKPTQNTLTSNLLLSAKKYFRGDERKILQWGLDLSGGKTVQIELRDQNNQRVTNEADLSQGVDELFNRVNKMGVSEVSIRKEGSNITLDFPGAQGLSAAELVKASSMLFHVVNEKYTPQSPELADSVNRFLQDVWNEAVVTNRKDVDSINHIAYKHLYGDSLDPENVQPRSDAANTLYESGLRLAIPDESKVTSQFNNSISKITVIRGNNYTDWFNQTHPLLVVFNNYALEGSNLDNVHASYDPTKGNFLSFQVKSSQTLRDGQKLSPRADLYSWTSTFSKDQINGTPYEQVSRGKGWRMAVILNGTVISAPALDSALKDSAMITGSFTHREINKLEADLKAGSLTFTPHILSEKNVSPELGIKERYQGILATVIALVLVIITMVSYYRFAGVIASVAVVFNLLIMWATLQNIQATMTLAGIAGIILTLGMAVDANVLVFERIREEFALTGRIASAVHAGYKKAFSAIVDSNITTIIAAVILLNFDSGPIKGFAITIIIGIISSMFTALFMTRFFFSGWVQNPKNKTLKMSTIIKASKFNFLKFGKLAMIISLAIALVGGGVIYKEKNSILGMDFTGGFALSVELPTEEGMNYRNVVENALVTKGLSSQDFQVRELSPSNHVRIFLSKALDKSGKPFYGLPLELTEETTYSYQNNPRIVWVVDALKDAGVSLSPKIQDQLGSNWTSISGQISGAMRNNALIGLSLALLCILVYITLRFEFKYALAATLGLAHDVIITIGTVCLLHAFRVPVQIDLNTIAALMTIVGYSLNDTIIIFDRVREDVKSLKKMSFKEVINHALNVTLSRTLMTSITTVLVLVALVCLGGSTVFGFALVMTIGVVYGTLSSLFVATPILYYIQKRADQKEEKLLPNNK